MLRSLALPFAVVAAYTIFGLSGIAQAAKPVPTHADVAYGSHQRHRLDLWVAKGEERRPLLVFIHGGGWAGGDKADVPDKLVQFMLEHDVSVASINYRFTSIAQAPAPLHDAARAVQFLRATAERWKIDPRHIGGYGISAGGVSVMWLALHDDLADSQNADPVLRESSKLQVAVGMSPPISLDAREVQEWIGDQVLIHPMIARAVGAKSGQEVLARYDEWKWVLRESSPLYHVSVGDPPVMTSFPRVDPLPAATPGSAIHHAIFGVKLKDRCDAAGVTCIRRIDESTPADVPTPEEFLLQHLAVQSQRSK